VHFFVFLFNEIDELADVRDRLERALSDEPPALATDPASSARASTPTSTKLRNLSQHSKQIIAAMEEREAQTYRHQLAQNPFQLRFRLLHGDFQTQSHLAPADYERKQTLRQRRAFTSPELKEYERKILAADERHLRN